MRWLLIRLPVQPRLAGLPTAVPLAPPDAGGVLQIALGEERIAETAQASVAPLLQVQSLTGIPAAPWLAASSWEPQPGGPSKPHCTVVPSAQGPLAAGADAVGSSAGMRASAARHGRVCDLKLTRVDPAPPV